MKQENYLQTETDKYTITDEQNNIIGCDSLITCTAILLYSPDYKKAGCLHLSIKEDFDPNTTKIKIEKQIIEFKSLLEYIIEVENNIKNPNIQYHIIPPAIFTDKTEKYLSTYKKTLEFLKTHPISQESIKDAYITISITEIEPVNCFAFDAKTGKFVTKEIFEQTHHHKHS